MYNHYIASSDRWRYRQAFGVEPPLDMGKCDVWPGYATTFIRRHERNEAEDGAMTEREVMTGLFGMVPPWAQDTTISHHSYDARIETVDQKPNFRDAWRNTQHCIIPTEAFFAPDWRTGHAVPTRVERADGQPMGIAGLWSSWKAPKGEVVHSFTMLTVNADEHPLMKNFHKPTDEKRIVAILPEDRYDDWLRVTPDEAKAFACQYSADVALQETQRVHKVGGSRFLFSSTGFRSKVDRRRHAR
jgi:putative SOS response-associated peptidase YedK